MTTPSFNVVLELAKARLRFAEIHWWLGDHPEAIRQCRAVVRGIGVPGGHRTVGHALGDLTKAGALVPLALQVEALHDHGQVDARDDLDAALFQE